MPVFGTHGDTGLPFVLVDGEPRILASLPAQREYSEYPRYCEAVSPVIPRSQWYEFEDDDSDLDRLDQDGEPSCCGHGITTSFQHAWRMAGNAPRKFAPTFMYSLINGGRNQGAVVGDGLEALLTKGVCLFDTMPDVHNVYERDQPQAAFQEALRFRLEAGYRVARFDEIVTAVILKESVTIGVEIGQAFEPDSDGVLPRRRGGGGGHCMSLRRGLRNINGVWHVKDQNSWGARWGKNGCCWIPESYFDGETDHFVLVAPRRDPQDNDLPVAHD